MKRIGYLFLASILGAVVGVLSAMLLTAFIPACGEDCSSEGLAILMYCLAGGMVLFAGAAGFAARHTIPSVKQSAAGGLALAGLCLLPAAGYYVLKLKSEHEAVRPLAVVRPDGDFPHMAVTTRPVQSESDARRGPVKPRLTISQGEKCLIGVARCDTSPRQVEIRCKTGIVYVAERDWSAFSLVPSENAPKISALRSMHLCSEQN